MNRGVTGTDEQRHRPLSGRLVDVEAERILPGTVGLQDGQVVRVHEARDVPDRFVLPGFVDAHVHIESSMLVPSRFAQLAVIHGTTTVVADPHEIANVLGLHGIRFMTQNAASVPLRFWFGSPSCVPATPFETAGGTIGSAEVRTLFDRDGLRHLSEMMNFPGVLSGDEDVMKKLALARERGLPIDGHAPGLIGESLRRYVAAGIGTDHETLDLAEGEEKISLGMKVQIREGSAASGLHTLLPLIDRHPGRCMLCTDDLHPDDLVRGHIDRLVRRAVGRGAGLFNVLRAASLVPALHYGFHKAGFHPGDRADFVVVDDLHDFRVRETYIAGRRVAADGKALFDVPSVEAPNNFTTSPKRLEDLEVPLHDGELRVITVTDGRLDTGVLRLEPKVIDGRVVADPDRDVLKVAVVNRYADAPPAVAFVRGLGLNRGALASSVAHDSHNIVAVGCRDRDLLHAVNVVIDNRGGLAAVADGAALALPLPVAGLMSTEAGLAVADTYERLDRRAKELGSPLTAPFMTLSFLSLPVIPKLRLTDRGLFDVETFHYTDLFVEGSSPVG